MTKRFYTFIIVPNASSRLHKIRIPVQVMYILAAIGMISFFVAVALGFSFTSMAFKVSDYNTLQVENTELKVQKKNLEVNTKKLSTKISNLETLSEKLTALIENDEFLKKRGKNGIGGTKTDYRTADILKGISEPDISSLKDRANDLEANLTLLQQKAEKRALVRRYTPTIWPLKGRIASVFGGRQDPFGGSGESEVHLGLDIQGMYGAPVHAPADGVVIFAGRKSDYGNLIIIDHGNGVTTRLGHMSRFRAKLGRAVTKGEIVGYVGMTGRTTGPHLHYEVRLNDRPVNPRRYLPDGD